MTDDPRTDHELIAALARGGDDRAFAALVARHYAMVYATCRRFTGNHHDAEDAAQGAFLTLAAKIDALGEVRSLAGWLHGVAQNVARRLRDAEAVRRRHEREAARTPAEGGPDPLAASLEEALALVPETYRIPLLLHYQQGESCSAIARRMGVREETVAMRLSRGRKLLRRRLLRSGAIAALPLLGAPEAIAAPAGLAAAGAEVARGGAPEAAPRVLEAMRGAADALGAAAWSGPIAAMALVASAALVVVAALVADAWRAPQPAPTSPISVAAAPPDLGSTSTLPGRETYHLHGETTAPYPYIEYLPGGYDDEPQRRWPLIVFLHPERVGARPVGVTPGELEWAVTGSPLAVARAGRHFPAVMLLPSCITAGDNKWLPWTTSAFLYHALATYRIDPRRIYVTGYQGGAIGAYDAVLGSTGLVSAILPIAGWAKWWPLDQHEVLTSTAIWAHVNQDDPDMRAHADETFDGIGDALGAREGVRAANPAPDRTRTAHWSAERHWEWTDGVTTTRADGSPAARDLHYTVHPTGGNDAWTATYRDEAVWAWLFRQTRADDGAPAIASTPPLTAVVGMPYRYVIETSGTPAPTLRLDQAPAWLSLDGNVLSGTPTEVAGPTDPDDAGHAKAIVLTARNGVRPDAMRRFRITVRAP